MESKREREKKIKERERNMRYISKEISTKVEDKVRETWQKN